MTAVPNRSKGLRCAAQALGAAKREETAGRPVSKGLYYPVVRRELRS